MAEEKHSLISEIMFDFSQAEKDIDKLVAKLKEIDNAFKSADAQVRKAGFNIGEAIRAAVEDIKQSDAQIGVDGSKILRRIERAFDSAIVSKGIAIKGIESAKPLEVTLSKTLIDKIQRQIEARLKEGLTAVKVSPIRMGDLRINLSDQSFEGLRQTIKERVEAELSKKLSFTLSDEAIRAIAEAKNIQFFIPAEAIKESWAAFERTLTEVFSAVLQAKVQFALDNDAKNELFGGKLTLKFSKGELNAIIDKIHRDLISDLLAKVDYKAEGELPKVRIDTSAIRTNLEQLQDELNRIISAASADLSPEQYKEAGAKFQQAMDAVRTHLNQIINFSASINEKLKDQNVSYESVIKGVEIIEKAVLQKVKYAIQQAQTAIKEAPLPTLDQSVVMSGLERLNKTISDKVASQFSNIRNQIAQAVVSQSDFNPADILKVDDKTLRNAFRKAIFAYVRWLSENISVPFEPADAEKVSLAVRGLIKHAIDVAIKGVKSIQKSIDAQTAGAGEIEVNVGNDLRTLLAKITSSINAAYAAIYTVTNAFSTIERALQEATDDVLVQSISEAESINQIKSNIQKAVTSIYRNLAKGIHDQMASLSVEEMLPPRELFVNLMQPIRQVTMRYIRAFSTALKRSIPEFAVSDQDLQIPYSKLDQTVRSRIASYLGTAASGVEQTHPAIHSRQAMEWMVKEHINTVLSELTNKAIKEIIANTNTIKSMINETKLPEPDMSPAYRVAEKLLDLQRSIISKTNEMIDMQFKTLRDYINKIPVLPSNLTIANKEVLKFETEKPQVKQTTSVPAPSARSIGSRAGATYSGVYFPVPVRAFEEGVFELADPGGHTRSFIGSIVNTIRYILSGFLVTTPMAAFYTGWRATREFDYQMMKAEQNYRVKILSATDEIVDKLGELVDQEVLKLGMSDVAVIRLQKMLGDQFNQMSKEERSQLVKEETLRLQALTNEQARKTVENIAIAYGLSLPEAARAFHISSRRYNDPNEALAMTRAVALVRALEETDIDLAAKGFEAIASQWGLAGYDIERVANMMIMAANITQAEIQDLIAVQQRAGTIFRRNLETIFGTQPASKLDALATSIALSSLFVQATARKGGEGGTFYRAIIDRPFRGEALEAMESYAQNKGFEFLNPYYIDEQGIKRQKSFIETFINIIAALRQMDPQTQKEFLFKVFPQWHMTSTTAVGDAIAELSSQLAEIGMILDRLQGRTVQSMESYTDPEALRKAFEEFTNKIKAAGEGDEEAQRIIDNLVALAMNTWDFQTRQIKSMWESTLQRLFDAFKPEFSQVNSYLLFILRYVRDNAGHVASIVGILSKIAAAFGVRFLGEKAVTAYREAVERNRRKDYERMISEVNEYGRYLQLKRILKGDELAYLNQQISRQQTTLELARGEYQAAQQARAQRKSNIKSIAMQYAELVRAGRVEEAAQLKQMMQEEAKLYREALKSEQEKQKEIARTERNIERMNNAFAKASDDMNELNYAVTRYNHMVAGLSKAMEDEGIRVDRLRNKLVQLNEVYTVETLNADRYAQQLRVIGETFGMTERDMLKFRKQLADLERQLASGAITQNQFFTRVQELERLHFATTHGIPGGGVKGEGRLLYGANLADEALALLGLGGIVGASMRGFPTRRGLIERIRDFASVLGRSVSAPFRRGEPIGKAIGEATKGAITSIGALFGRSFQKDRYGRIITDEAGRPVRVPTTVAGTGAAAEAAATEAALLARAGQTASKAGLFGKALGRIGSVGGLIRAGAGAGLRFLGPFGAAIIGLDVLSAAWDVASSAFMLEHERLATQAAKLRDLEERAKAVAETRFLPLKLLGALNIWWKDWLLGGVSNLFGGNAPSFGEASAALRLAFSGLRGQELNLELDKALRVREKELEARIKQREYFDAITDPLERLKLGRIDETIQDQSVYVTPEDAQEIIKSIQQALDLALSKSQSEFTIDQAKLLLQGVSEDSKKMRDLMEEYLTKNIELLEENLKDLRERKSKIAPESEGYKLLDAYELQLQAQKAQLEVQRRENRFTQYNEIMRTLSEDQALIGYKYDIIKYRALAGGVPEDSPFIRNVESQRAQELRLRIEQTQNQLRNLLSEFNANSREWKTIWLAIQQLSAEQARLLADINKQLNTRATFNLPSGIAPISYMEYVTERNTHSNFTIRQGDVIVNVTIDNMTGSQEDINRLARAVAKEAQAVQYKVPRTLANQVLSGMQNNNFPPRDPLYRRFR